MAVGQAADHSALPQALRIVNGSRIEVDPVTLETNLTGVFEVGNFLGGAGSVVASITSGRKATVSINCSFREET